MVVPTTAWKWWSGSIRSGQAETLDQALSLMVQAQREDDSDSALRAADHAIEIAERTGIEPPGGLVALNATRDDLARAEAGRILDSLSSQPPEQALKLALELSSQADSDPALSTMDVRLTRSVAESATRWTDQVLDQAQEAVAEGRQTEAMDRLERLAAELDRPPRATMAAQLDRVEEAAIALIERYGARVEPIEPVAGPFSDPRSDFRSDVIPEMRKALRSRGYLIASEGPPLEDLWSKAPYRMRGEIVEKVGATYLQSPHRTSLISVDLALDRDGRTIWRDYFEARTRVPLQGLSAMESSRMVLGREPSPEIERRLYQDARTDLLTKLVPKLGALPSP